MPIGIERSDVGSPAGAERTATGVDGHRTLAFDGDGGRVALHVRCRQATGDDRRLTADLEVRIRTVSVTTEVKLTPQELADLLLELRRLELGHTEAARFRSVGGSLVLELLTDGGELTLLGVTRDGLGPGRRRPFQLRGVSRDSLASADARLDELLQPYPVLGRTAG